MYGAETRNILGFVAFESLAQGIERALDSLGVALQRALTPAILAFLVRNLDEQPPGQHPEVFNARDLDHFRRAQWQQCVNWVPQR